MPSILGMVAIAAVCGGVAAPGPEESVLRDCGPRSRFWLAGVEGRFVAPSEVASASPRERSGHFSLAELRDAAAKLGLHLSGVRLASGPAAPDRPALAVLRRVDHGHFVVIRPAGHTGKLVQLLDPNDEPRVLDAAALYASPEWTGLALVPDRTSRSAGAAGLLAIGLGGLGLAGAARSRIRPVRGRSPREGSG